MASKREYYGNIHAPEFPAGAEWLNTTERYSLAKLRGRLVLLDFWTYGCINCMHVLPDLKRLEKRYMNDLVVIGVHSAKFANEANSENIRRIIARYEITHPVINDADMSIWQSYGVRAWPTTVLIDPRGNVLAAHSGEGVYAAYADLIQRAIEQYRLEGALVPNSPVDLAAMPVSSTMLSFPGKVVVDPIRQALVIADTGNNRIVITSLEGVLRRVIGSGEPGLRDGSFESAALNKPQGLAVVGQHVYIADTGNHALRLADLDTGQITTLIGDGQLTYQIPAGQAKGLRLNSPWDLSLVGNRLFIAMAGLHQIYEYDTEQGTIQPFAGSGREGLSDGPRLNASMAQPSGLASGGKMLYVADSEASAIRMIELDGQGRVRTLVGEGLFDFGDIDGPGNRARLQHALGVTLVGDVLYIADTYNHKIKRLDLATQELHAYLGDTAGYQDGEQALFFEPGGLASDGLRLYVADTNNHCIRVANLGFRQVSTLNIGHS